MSETLFPQMQSLLRLFRGGNALALGMLYVAAETHYSHNKLSLSTILRAAAWVSISSAAYAYNDVRDVSIDRINHPKRPIPSGECSSKMARSAVLGAGAIGFAFSIIGWPETAIIPLCALLLGILYSAHIRARSALAANLLSSVLVSAIPLSAGLRLSEGFLSLAIGVALITFARELQKDALDRNGDQLERSPALLIGGHKKLFSILYPIVVLIAAYFLYDAFQLTPTRAGLKVLVPLSVLLPLGFTLISWAAVSDSGLAQARLLKIAAYLLVPALILT